MLSLPALVTEPFPFSGAFRPVPPTAPSSLAGDRTCLEPTNLEVQSRWAFDVCPNPAHAGYLWVFVPEVDE